MRKILTLLFVLFLSASAFGAWVVENNTSFDKVPLYKYAAYSTNTSLTLYSAGNHGGFFVSTNYGSSWVNRSMILNPPDIRAMAVGGGTVFAGGGPKILFSSDSGSNWHNTATSPNFTNINGIAAKSASDLVVVGDQGGAPKIAWSNNAGSSWTAATLPGGLGANVPQAVCYLGNNTYVCAAKGGKIIKSTDNGANWSNLSSGTALDLADVFFYNGSVGFAVGGSAPLTPIILYTSNGGTTWSTLSSPANHVWSAVYIVAGASSGDLIAYLVGHDSGDDLDKIYSTTSSNSGTSWSSLSFQYQAAASSVFIRGLYCDDRYNLFAAGISGINGITFHNITPLSFTSIEQALRPGQNSFPRGFTGNAVLHVVNAQRRDWSAPGAISFSSSDITLNSATRTGPDDLTLNLSIGSAASGPYNISGVNTDGLTATLPGGGSTGLFGSLPPSLITIDPSRVRQNWIGTITATGEHFQVDPLTAITFAPQTTGTTLEIIGTPTIVSSTTAVVTVSAFSVGNFRFELTNADGGYGFIDFFVVDPSISPPSFESISFDGITYDATTFPYPPGQLISPTTRIVAVFTDTDNPFNATSQNTAKFLASTDSSLTIYNVPASSVSLTDSNTRAIIDYQIPAGTPLHPNVNTIKAYMENGNGEARIQPARVRIGYLLRKNVPDNVALPSHHVWNPDKEDLDLQWKLVGPVTLPPAVKIETRRVDGVTAGSHMAATRVVFSYDDVDPQKSYKIVNISTKKSLLLEHELSQGLLLFIIHDDSTIYAKAKVMVQYR